MVWAQVCHSNFCSSFNLGMVQKNYFPAQDNVYDG